MPVLPRALLAGLFDDAAVFPPGNTPLDRAVAAHRRLRRGPDADLVGPLLLPASAIPAAADLAGLADLTRDEPPAGELPPDDEPPGELPATGVVSLDVSVISRPGGDLDQVVAAAAVARDDPRLELRGVEVGWQEDWRALRLDAPAIVLELPRGTEQALALTDLATAVAENEACRRYLAKFRTGRTETWDWPAERELARVIQAAVAMDVPLKLTGGLHHAIRSTLADGEHHGVLNVLACFAAARTGRPVDALAGILAQRAPEPLLQALAVLSPANVRRLRTDFAAYGCCTVTEPIGELTDLGVLEGKR